ncbi:MAG: tyrosine-type recombinase/integrase [Candidatus Undinarchaeales archaeon]|jgi:site-specific recombinase XerD|nr:tyrosine-type recombinase/integrase [Candidatus Undinarchaeales archaeon]MDP7493308.1 tyrosine-type recombinase/integrase [Candidatus Undinarchaeales archaeon]
MAVKQMIGSLCPVHRPRGQVWLERMNDRRIGITVPDGEGIVDRLMSLNGLRWHRDGGHWSVPDSTGTVEDLQELFDGYVVVVDPSLPGRVAPLEEMRRELVARRYSPRTAKAYLRFVREFLGFANKPAGDIDNSDIRRFLAYLSEKRCLSDSTLNQAANAIRFLYWRVYDKRFDYTYCRPKKAKRLPIVLRRDEMARLLDAIPIMRNKLIIMLLYGSGLRVGEAVRLRPEDIDHERGVIFVRNGKGKKDRYTVLSSITRDYLTQYCSEHRPRTWIFEVGERKGHVHERTVQHAIVRARRRAGIDKRVTTHTLRHSFATHLLEDGANLFHIKKLLGHKHIQTTLKYTHMTTKDVARIRSPLDRLNAGREPAAGIGGHT